MSKVPDYELRGLPQQAIDMLDDIRDLLNNGKNQTSVATTGIPGWTANTGESAFFASGSDRRLYLRTSSSWLLVSGFDPTLTPSALGTASAGTGNVFSLVDHIHEGSFATPVAIDTANNAGTGTTFARATHQHLGFLQAGSMQAFTTTGGSTWTRPTGVSRVYTKVWGAGGGGGGGTNTVSQAGDGVVGSLSSFAGSVVLSSSGGSGGVGANNASGGIGGSGGLATGGAVTATGQSGAMGSNALTASGGIGGQAFGGGGGGLASGALSSVGGTGGAPGGGGSGGNAVTATAGGGGGGGAGGFTEGFVTVTGNVTVTIGSGGTGGAGAGAPAGGNGGVGGQGLVMVYW